jgi:hypothetical protein
LRRIAPERASRIWKIDILVIAIPNICRWRSRELAKPVYPNDRPTPGTLDKTDLPMMRMLRWHNKGHLELEAFNERNWDRGM